MKEVKASVTTNHNLKGLHIYSPSPEEFERALFKAWDMGIPRVWVHWEAPLKWLKWRIEK